MIETTGSWKQHKPPVYFFSGFTGVARMHDLLPVPDLPWLLSMYMWGNQENIGFARKLAGRGSPILFDSGVFTLLEANQNRNPYYSEPDLGGREARELIAKSDDVYGDPWWQKKAWGFIEFDLGPPEAKTRTRQRLEDRWGMGLIPVFHLVVNPWSYLHTLADEYDRICVTVP